MKEYTGLTSNVYKTIKTGEDDTNEEGIYAELNILVSETKYEISNARDVTRTRQVDEIEIMISTEGVRRMAKYLLDLVARMEMVTKRESDKDKVYDEYEED